MSDYKGFSSIVDLVKAIYKEGAHGVVDERLAAHKAVTGINESTASEGGYLVTEQIIGPILSSIQQNSVLYSKSTKLRTSMYGAKVPFVSETTRTHGGAGNLNAYWVGEGVQKTEDIPQFGQIDVKMHKLVCMMTVTDELIDDSVMLQDFIDAFVGEKIGWNIDRAMLYGAAATSMTGLFSVGGTNGTIGVATADPIDEATLELYAAALAPAAHKNAEWYMSKENWNDINAIAFTNENSVYFNGGQMYIYGWPVNVMEQMSGVCQDIMLGDISQYAVIQKGDITKAINISLRYDYDESKIRWVIRLNGNSFGQAYTLEDGTNVGTFVIPECAPPVESSSSSSFDSSSSSSSSSVLHSSSSSSSTSSVDSSSSSSSGDYSSSSSSSVQYSSSSSSSSSELNSSSSSSSSSSSGDYSGSSSTSSVEHSSSSSSKDSSSTSSESLAGCDDEYCGQQFINTDLDVTWYFEGYYAGHPYYTNGGQPYPYYLFYDETYNRYVISKDLGDPPDQWLTAQDIGDDCPAGDYVGDDNGFITAGPCA